MDAVRRNKLMAILEEMDGACTLEMLSHKLYASRSTIRRMVIELEKVGLVERYHGGVALVKSSASENSVEKRKMQNLDKKLLIARVASKYLHDNIVIFMDSSSTVNQLCPYLKNFKNVTVITNGLDIAEQLSFHQNIICYICPGVIKHKSLSIIGQYAIDFLSNFKAEYAFLSCKAVSEDGIFEGDDTQALIKRNMLRYANKSFLLCDDSKQFQTGFFRMSTFKEIDILITNTEFEPHLAQTIRESNCTIELAE